MTTERLLWTTLCRGGGGGGGGGRRRGRRGRRGRGGGGRRRCGRRGASDGRHASFSPVRHLSQLSAPSRTHTHTFTHTHTHTHQTFIGPAPRPHRRARRATDDPPFFFFRTFLTRHTIPTHLLSSFRRSFFLPKHPRIFLHPPGPWHRVPAAYLGTHHPFARSVQCFSRVT